MKKRNPTDGSTRRALVSRASFGYSTRAIAKEFGLRVRVVDAVLKEERGGTFAAVARRRV